VLLGVELAAALARAAGKPVVEVDKYKLEESGVGRQASYKPVIASLVAALGKVCGVAEDSKIEMDNLEWVGVLVIDKVEWANIERRLPAETRAQGANRYYRRNTIGRFWLQ
jgi:hypothetical protein